MRMLLWDVNNHYLIDQHGEINLVEKPNLSFDFVSVRYVEGGEFWTIDSNSARNDLGDEQILEIHEYIKSQREIHGIKVMAVDVHGDWLGFVDQNDPRIDTIVTEFPPTSDEWNWCNGEWLRVWYIDKDNHLTDKDNSVERVFSNKYPGHFTDVWDYAADAWVHTQSLDVFKLDGLNQLIFTAINSLDKKVLDQKAFLLELIEAVIDVSKKHISEVDHIKLSTSIDAIADEVINYCETPNDIQLSISNLALYT